MNLIYQKKNKAKIKCDDTDILIILLGNLHKLKQDIQITLLFGVSDHMRLIDMLN